MASNTPTRVRGAASVQPSSCSKLFNNHTFEAVPDVCPGEDVTAELQAARLRLEAAEGDKAALAAELAAVQARLHDSLEVLEGLLGERASLLKQNHGLQAQLATALEERRGRLSGGAPPAGASACSSPGAGTPRQHLRHELLLAKAQLAELRQQQQAWEGERQQMVVEGEEERQRLQEGLAEALNKATSAQLEADAAAERASHWCTLAQLLQRSALQLDTASPLSPASTACHYSPPGSALQLRSCRAGSHASLLRLLPDCGSPAEQGGCGGAIAEAGEEGPGLIAAFNAAMAAAAAAQPQGSPTPLHGQSLRSMESSSPEGSSGSAGSAGTMYWGSGSTPQVEQGSVGPAVTAVPSAALPGGLLGLKRTCVPVLRLDSLAGTQSPATPAPAVAGAGKVLATPFTDSAGSQPVWRSSGSPTNSSAAGPTGRSGRRQPTADKRGFLGRLLCAVNMPTGQPERHSRMRA